MFADMINILKHKSHLQAQVTRIIEFCCEEDSEIEEQAEMIPNVEVLRCTKEHDVTTTQGMDTCLENVKAHSGAHLRASIPCTPWSPIQELNLHLYRDSFEQYLNEEKDKSLQLMGQIIRLARVVKNMEEQSVLSGRRAAPALEWEPNRAMDQRV